MGKRLTSNLRQKVQELAPEEWVKRLVDVYPKESLDY